jgi:hypothetical protein
MMEKPIVNSPPRATSVTVSASPINSRMRSVRYCHPSPSSIRSRDSEAIVGASLRLANWKVTCWMLMTVILP